MRVRTLLALTAVASVFAAPSPDFPDESSNARRDVAMRLPISKREMGPDKTDPRAGLARLSDERLRMRLKYSKYLDADGRAKLDRELEDRRHQTADVQKRGAPVTFTGWGFDLCYTVPLSVGTPPQTFELMMDTGSVHMWVLDECTNATECARIPLYQPDKSSSYQATTTPFRVEYVLGETTGMWGYDSVRIGECSVLRQPFGVVDHATEWLSADTNRTGLVGFGWAAGTRENVKPFWETLAPTWPEPVFSVYLQRATEAEESHETSSFGSLILGGIDSSLYQGDINYIPIPTQQAMDWVLPLEGMSVAGQAINTNITARVNEQVVTGRPYAAIDTGTTYILGPIETVAAVHENIPGAIQIVEGIYIFPCDKDPELRVSFTFGGQTYTLEDTDFMADMWHSSDLIGAGILTPGTPHELWCRSGILGMELGEASVPWIIGAAFMKNVYTVFRYDPPAVGFAKLSDSATKFLQNETIPGNPTSLVSGIPTDIPGGPGPIKSNSIVGSPTPGSTGAPGEASAASRYSAQYTPVVLALAAMVAVLV